VALGDSYATLAELKTRLTGIASSLDDNAMTNALAVASRGIEHVCGRQFNKTTSATTRVFYPDNSCRAIVDDFHTTTDLVVKTDDGDDGTYETTWSTSDYQLEPINGILDGESGWPYWKIRAVSGRWFPTSGRRAPLQVTAQWGWTAVPVAVKEACLAVAQDTFQLRGAPFGVGGNPEWGTFRVRANPMAMSMIAPYSRNPFLVA
jgi:hypothetical protein